MSTLGQPRFAWIVSVSAGRGPTEVRRFVALLAAHLQATFEGRWAKVDEVITSGPVDEPRSVRLVVNAPRDLVAAFEGTHCLVEASRGRGQRKRWYARVSLEAGEDPLPVEVDPRDVEITTARAGGPGGQHVNKTASAVRAVHGPTGLSVRVTSERSQHANLRIALRRLGWLLEERARDRADERAAAAHRALQGVERGSAAHTWRLRGERLEATCAAT